MHFFLSPFNFVFVEQQAEKPIAQRILFRLTLYLKLAMTLIAPFLRFHAVTLLFLKKNTYTLARVRILIGYCCRLAVSIFLRSILDRVSA